MANQGDASVQFLLTLIWLAPTFDALEFKKMNEEKMAAIISAITQRFDGVEGAKQKIQGTIKTLTMIESRLKCKD